MPDSTLVTYAFVNCFICMLVPTVSQALLQAFFHIFIMCSFTQQIFWCACSVPGTVLGVRDITVNKTQKSVPCGAHILARRRETKHKQNN